MERENLKRALVENQKNLDRKSEECAEQRGALSERICQLEKGCVTGRTGASTERALRESIDNILTDRLLNQTVDEDLKWYREDFERQEEHIGIFFFC